MQLRRSIATAVSLGTLLAGGLTGAALADTPDGRQPAHASSLVAHDTRLGRDFTALENERDGTRRERQAERIVSAGYIQHNPTVTGDPFLGVAPRGQKLEWDGVDIWTVRDGKLYEHWDQFDWPRALVQLGVQGLPQFFVQAASRPVGR
ncbi:ester cyclase [Streptomyces sp. NPDC026672]|uniref:ester cyclase n=1 Tax=unclassified Streptomyces TaxID=2593676 RepID=UPI0033D03DFA